MSKRYVNDRLEDFLRSSSVTYFTRVKLCYALSLCLYESVSSRCSIERDGRIELISGKEASFHPSFTVL